MSNTAPQIHVIDPDEKVAVAVSFDNRLESGETLNTPTVTVESGAPAPTISGEGTNGAEQTINDIAVPIGRAATFFVESATAGVDYSLKVSCTTSASQTRVGYVTIRCR